MVGPITLAFHLFAGDTPYIYNKDLTAIVGHSITKLACWQVQRLQRCHVPVLLFLDEPCLALLDSARLARVKVDLLAVLKGVIAAIQEANALAGLHCCAVQPSFAAMRQVAPDILSFDGYQGLEAFFGDADARAFLLQGGFVAYGLVPTLSTCDQLDPGELFSRWLLAATDLPDIRELACRSMITATCGQGLLSPSAASQSFRLAQQVAALMQKVAGSPRMIAKARAGSSC